MLVQYCRVLSYGDENHMAHLLSAYITERTDRAFYDLFHLKNPYEMVFESRRLSKINFSMLT